MNPFFDGVDFTTLRREDKFILFTSCCLITSYSLVGIVLTGLDFPCLLVRTQWVGAINLPFWSIGGIFYFPYNVYLIEECMLLLVDSKLVQTCLLTTQTNPEYLFYQIATSEVLGHSVTRHWLAPTWLCPIAPKSDSWPTLSPRRRSRHLLSRNVQTQ